MFKHTHTCVWACSFSHHKIFSHIKTERAAEFIKFLLLFLQYFVIHTNTDWSLTIRLRMRAFLLLFSVLFKSETANTSCLCMSTVCCLHFMWFGFICLLFIYLLALEWCWNVWFPFQTSTIHSSSNKISFWFFGMFTFYYRFLIVELQNCCRCIQSNGVLFLFHTQFTKKIIFCFELKEEK